MRGILGDLADLLLPTPCAGCAAQGVPLRMGACAACVAAVEGLAAHPVAPTPAPEGMPPCTAMGDYAGPLRGLLLAYKERGSHRLRRPLGALLACSIAACAVREGGGPGIALTIVPVPSTASAARERRGDHMVRLAREAAGRLRAAGWAVSVERAMKALPKDDSVSLGVAGRAVAAENSLRIRGTWLRFSRRAPTMGGTLIVVDDIVTTGATLAAVTGRLREVDMQVTGAAVLAATRLRAGRRRFVHRNPNGVVPGS